MPSIKHLPTKNVGGNVMLNLFNISSTPLYFPIHLIFLQFWINYFSSKLLLSLLLNLIYTQNKKNCQLHFKFTYTLKHKYVYTVKQTYINYKFQINKMLIFYFSWQIKKSKVNGRLVLFYLYDLVKESLCNSLSFY